MISWSWDRLRVLAEVAHMGSIGQAADVLQMTSPAVSQQIRRLEAELGARVIEPDGRGIRLTSEGAVLAGYAVQVADLMQQADNDLAQEGEVVGTVRVASIASAVRTILAPSLPDFLVRHPRVAVTVTDGETANHLQELIGRKRDIVIAESWTAFPARLPAGVNSHLLVREPVFVVLHAAHPLASSAVLDITDLTDEAWATCTADSDTYMVLTQLAHAQGVDLAIRYTLADHLTQLAMVDAGLAVACVPASASPYLGANTVQRPIASPLQRDILLLTRQSTQNRAVQRLADHLCVSAAAIAEPPHHRGATNA